VLSFAPVGSSSREAARKHPFDQGLARRHAPAKSMARLSVDA